jgi:hypothetical protein
LVLLSDSNNAHGLNFGWFMGICLLVRHQEIADVNTNIGIPGMISKSSVVMSVVIEIDFMKKMNQ